MRCLVIGSGGRENALAWKLSEEADVHCAPGNPGTEAFAANHAVRADDASGIIALARHIRPDVVLIGPENPLIAGLADDLRSAGFATVGPGAAGARLEASKAWSKEVMALAGVPTAESVICTNPESAREAANEFFGSGRQAVVKASGAALGKGVVVAETADEANQAIEQFMVLREIGEAGSEVVIEERLLGREFSLLTLCNSTGVLSLPVAQDYKRVGDDDSGPNTGGMGSYSPVSWVSTEMVRDCERRFVEPVLAKLSEQGIAYRGVLFTGLMQTDDGPKCLEYNVRFGDPETQSIMARLGSGFAETLRCVAADEPIAPPIVKVNAAVTVVIASENYPSSPSEPALITIDPHFPSDVGLFFAGVTRRDELLYATGGRVLNITATGDSLGASREKAYSAVEWIHFEGMKYRKDIAREK